jgi:hypothetical protein
MKHVAPFNTTGYVVRSRPFSELGGNFTDPVASLDVGSSKLPVKHVIQYGSIDLHSLRPTIETGHVLVSWRPLAFRIDALFPYVE